MTLLTIFSAPKAFSDAHIALIQTNAIESWKRLPDAEILLLGDEAGLSERAAAIGVRHIPEVARNEKQTPLISSMFEQARRNSTSPLLCIVNSDIILMQDFMEAVGKVVSLTARFLLFSRRWDAHIEQPQDFSEGWQDRLRGYAHSKGHLHRPRGSDYFVFPRECFAHVPAFAIGRAGWDNWMIYQALQEKLKVIDATPSVCVIHQEHGYGHLPGGKAHHALPETDANIRMAGGQAAIRYTPVDANYWLLDGRLLPPAWSRARALRVLELFLRRLLSFLPERQIESVVRPRRWWKRLRRLFR